MAKSACPMPPGSQDYGDRGTAWHPMIFISLACLGITMATSISLIILHLRRYRAPAEQRQIVRIVFSVVVYSLVAFIELYKYQAAQYVDPLGDVYEAFGLCALFFLFVQYAAPTGQFDDQTLKSVRTAAEIDVAFDWPKIGWVFVFQYPVVEIFCVALQEATEATGDYCTNSLSPRFAHIWVEILESISIGACVISIWKMRERMKSRLHLNRGLAKLLCFKVIVFIRFMQQWVFSLLLEYHAIKPSSTFSYNDILWGISATATCVEMVLFAGGFWYAFSSTEYSSNAKAHVPRLPLWRAVIDALNPSDIVMGILRIVPFIIQLKRDGEWRNYRLVTQEQGVSGLVRKGIRKYKARKGQTGESYYALGETSQVLNKPAESHYSPDLGRMSTSGGMRAGDVYQPPEGSPPDDMRTPFMNHPNATRHGRSPSDGYLMADSGSYGRPRASSQSSLMAESQPYPSHGRSPSEGYRPDGAYNYSRSPSPNGYPGAPTQGRDWV